MKPEGKVLVWGGLGFMGQHLTAELLRRGAAVSILCRSRRLYPTPEWAAQVGWFELEEGKDRQETLAAAVASAAVIFDFAGSSGAVASNRQPLASLDANCRSQLELLQACGQAGHRPHIVFPSSWLVYGETGSKAITETHPVAPRSVYAAHKLCVEHYLRVFAQDARITYTVCRISNPYGYDPSRCSTSYKLLNAFIQRALAGQPLPLFGDGSQLRDFIYISDVVDALLRCGFSPPARNEVFNISSGKSYSLREAVEMISRRVEGVAVTYEAWPAEYKAVESGDYLADISKARNKLGFAPTYDLPAGLERTLEQYWAHTAQTQQEQSGG